MGSSGRITGYPKPLIVGLAVAACVMVALTPCDLAAGDGIEGYFRAHVAVPLPPLVVAVAEAPTVDSAIATIDPARGRSVVTVQRVTMSQHAAVVHLAPPPGVAVPITVTNAARRPLCGEEQRARPGHRVHQLPPTAIRSGPYAGGVTCQRPVRKLRSALWTATRSSTRTYSPRW